MGLGDIFHKVIGAAAAAVGSVPKALSHVTNAAVDGASNGPALPDIVGHLSAAATTPHPDGGTVLDHYVRAAGAGALAVAVQHVPKIPAGIKTFASVFLIGWAVKAVDGAVAHLQSAYVAPPAPAPAGAPPVGAPMAG